MSNTASEARHKHDAAPDSCQKAVVHHRCDHESHWLSDFSIEHGQMLHYQFVTVEGVRSRARSDRSSQWYAASSHEMLDRLLPAFLKGEDVTAVTCDTMGRYPHVALPCIFTAGTRKQGLQKGDHCHVRNAVQHSAVLGQIRS